MSDDQRAALDEGEAPVNPYSLLEAVNDSSDTVHTGWLIFIGIMSYVLVAVAGVTHKDLLLSRDIPLPILQVGIELTRFFLFAPIVIVLFHVGVITQLVMLARKTLELDRALRLIEVTERRSHPLRLELHNFFFVQAIAGPERSRIVGGLLHGLSWLTLIVLPLLVLLYIQVAFLPYHDIRITWAHRVALVADMGLLVLIGVFLTRAEQSLLRALWGATLAHPLTVLVSILVLMTVSAFSFMVATVPGERIDVIGRRLTGDAGPVARMGGTASYGFMVPFLNIGSEGKLLGLFERNLNVTDLDLVVDKDVTAGEPTLNLRRRDLRHARLDRSDLHQADLTGADLEGASLVGADLRGVLLHCADVTLLLLTEDRRGARCPKAAGANFNRAKLSDADLTGLDLTGARLEETDLTGASLAHANLTGASLYSARLERVDLTGGIAMQGANLATASAQGADFTGAKLDAADLTSASLQGAILDFASLAGASLRDADLEGASLYVARLPAANLSGANIQGASLRGAWVWRATSPDGARTSLADLTGVRLSPPSKEDATALGHELSRILGGRIAERLKDALATVNDATDAKAAVENTPGRQAPEDWQNVIKDRTQDASIATRDVAQAASLVSTGPINETAAQGVSKPAATVSSIERKNAVADYLVKLACKPRWADGAVATGITMRALGPGFDGDPVRLLEGLKREDCPGGKLVPARLLAKLAVIVETVQGR